MTLPEGWTVIDVRNAVPPEAVADVINFCKTILRESRNGGSVRGIISVRAKEILAPHKDAFAARGVLADFFAYQLEHQFNRGQLGVIVKALEE